MSATSDTIEISRNALVRVVFRRALGTISKQICKITKTLLTQAISLG